MIVKPLEQIDDTKHGDQIVICVAKSKGKSRKWEYSSALGLGRGWRYYKTNSSWVHQKWLAQHYLGLEQSKSIMAFSVDKIDFKFDNKYSDLNYVVFDDKEYNAFNKLLTDKKEEEKIWKKYKKQWDEASMKECFSKGDLTQAGRLSSGPASIINRTHRLDLVDIRRKIFEKLIAKYPKISYNKYTNIKKEKKMAKKTGLYAFATIINKDNTETFEMKPVSSENRKVEAGLFSKTVQAKNVDSTVEVQLVKFKTTVY